MHMSEQKKIETLRIFLEFVKAEVRRRGGRVEISLPVIRELMWRGWWYKREGQTVVFTLGEADTTRRDLNTFAAQWIYRFDMVLKYLISTAPDQRLVFTGADLRDNVRHLTIGRHLDGLFVLATDQDTPSPGDVTTTIGTTITRIEHKGPPIPDRKN